MDVQGAKALLGSLQAQAHQLEGVMNKYKSEVVELEKTVLQLDHDILLRTKTSEVLKNLMDEVVASKVKVIDDLVSMGLQKVFSDQNIAFKSEIQDKNNRLWIDFLTTVDGIEGDTVDSFGGGIVNVTSFLLRVITQSKLGLAPYLQLDESFNNVSALYVPNTGRLLKAIAHEMKTTILLITHQPGFLEFADTGYEASSIMNEDGFPCLKLKKLSLKEAK